MTRLLVHVEGQTEENFVNEVLGPHLHGHGFSSVRARLMGNARQRSNRGGIRGWPQARRDIVRHLREDRECVATLMVDYYGLPQRGGAAWPGRAQASHRPFVDKSRLVEEGMASDIRQAMGDGFNACRFVPRLMMHEFEALLFSDCDTLGAVIGHSELAPHLQQIKDSFESAEQINESPGQAPSKRIEALYPGYQKPLIGTLAAQKIGLLRIRAECPHFSSWIDRLESLPRTL